MHFSGEFFLRLVGAVIFSIAGVYLGIYLGEQAGTSTDVWGVVFFLVGILVGLIGTPYITTRPARAARQIIAETKNTTLVAGSLGALAGLVAAALLTSPLSQLPGNIGNFAPSVSVVVMVWLGATLFIIRREDLMNIWLRLFQESKMPAPSATANGASENTPAINSPSISPAAYSSILLDTSVLIDGRIADVSQTGFIAGTLLVPRFVLNELQHIADSSDTLRRNRGRRGLEILSRLQKETPVPVKITDMDVEGIREVDDKLVMLGKQLHCPIMTNDYNLNRVAEIQSVQVLNINDLANAVKVVFLPGENLTVRVIQEGREYGQGVGYLEDGTMIVIENGKHYINQSKSVTVTKVLQTAAGRMIFARLEEEN